jgi:uncharacterized protein GlcG (DUF336 family)
MRVELVGIALALAPIVGNTADIKALVPMQSLAPAAALTAAQAALARCDKEGYTAAVAIVDRSGVPLVALRNHLAGAHTFNTAVAKAWTAVSFRGDTTTLAKSTVGNQPGSGIRQLPGVVMVGGGWPIAAGGAQVGGIGVSGAPSPEADDVCAKAGMDAIRDMLELG